MMPNFKRCLSLLMVFALLWNICPISALAAETASTPTQGYYTGFITNPLYSFLEETAPQDDGLSSTDTAQNTDVEYVSEAEAACLLRDAMVAREPQFSINVCAADGTLDIEKELLPTAYSETLAKGNTDGDYLRWSFKSLGWNGTYSGNNYRLTFSATYYTTAQQESAFLATMAAVLDSMDLEEKTTYQKISAIYTYITDHVDYDYDALARINAEAPQDGDELIYSAYGALMNKKAVCQGFTCLFYAMCRSAGLPVRIISNEGHAWNILKIGDLWYNMDVTWDGQDAVSYKRYFLKGSDNFANHTPDSEFLTAAFTSAYPISTGDYVPGDADLCTTHSYDSGTVITAATCTTPGKRQYTCTVCGVTKTEPISILGHRNSIEIVVAASCTKDGYTARGCERCDYYYIESTSEALSHNYTTVVTAPTCTTAGYTTHTCSRCSDSYADTETDALGHSWGDGIVTKPATETEDGEKTYTCSRCNGTKTEVIPVVTHTYDTGIVTTKATCTENGVKTFTCTDPGCGKTYTEIIPSTGHDWDSGTISSNASCTEAGEKTYACRNCTETKTEIITAIGHRHQTVTTEATCTEPGRSVATCIYCDDQYEVSVTNVLGHEWDVRNAVVTAPTCTSEGYTTYPCTRCDETKTDDYVSMLEHTYQTTASVAVTCTDNGTVTEVCSACGDIKITTILTTGHSYSASVTAPTCTTGGYTTYTCGKCGDHYTDHETSALNHNYKSTTLAATCTTAGSITYTCTRSGCGHSYTTVTSDALGHCWDAGKITTEATCTSAGVRTYTCSRCPETKVSLISSTGHSYTVTRKAATCTAQGYTDHTCKTCGHSYQDSYTSALGHKWNSGTVTLEPTATKEGRRTYTCQRCSRTKTESIPATGPKNPFTDVVEGKFYYNAVLWAVENGITTGTTETTFDPDGTCTRAQVVTFLWRQAGCPEPTITKHNFTDVKKTAYYYKAMLWAIEMGITNGTSATTFAPNEKCTRGQVVTFLWRAAKCPAPIPKKHSFTDIQDGKYYYSAVSWAVENGITNGTSATTFAPNASCTRGQVVTFLYRYAN